MYAAVMCPSCGRPRVIRMSSASTSCPYCGTRASTSEVRVMYRGGNASEVREVLVAATGPKAAERRKGEDPDPMSTLEHMYERARGLDEKLRVLAEGLTRMKGTFTVEDVERFEPEKAEAYIMKMGQDLLVIEERPGRYRSSP